MVGVGFAAGVAWRGERSAHTSNASQPVRIHVICDSPFPTNPFDLTRPAQDFPEGDLEMKSHGGRENSL